MIALIDGDILRYEIGFAAETGWKAITGDSDRLPPFDYVEHLLNTRIANILAVTKAEGYRLYLTEGETFRYAIAKTKPYKGTRRENKPWHFNNLTIYMKDVLDANVITCIEADDAMAVDSLAEPGEFIICSRDKDLRQVPGWSYSWELGNQPSFGPVKIDDTGYISFTKMANKITGTGFNWFCVQLLIGDAADNIPGLPGWGPAKAWRHLEYLNEKEHVYNAVCLAYEEAGMDDEYLLEQGRLLWMTRRMHYWPKPVLWELGMME